MADENSSRAAPRYLTAFLSLRMKQKPFRNKLFKNKPERIIQQEIRLAAPNYGYTLWRNQTGVAWQGGVIQDGQHRIILENPRRVRFGLTVGSSDLIGLRTVIVTPEMVGSTVAVFAALEVKTTRGKATEKQQNFVDFVAGAGGIGVIVRSEEDIPR